MSAPTATEPATAEAPATDPAVAPPRSRQVGRALLVAGLVAVVLGAVIAIVAARDTGPPETVVTIPADANGSVDNVIDAIIRVEPDGELVVRNNDDRLHVVGPITVEAGTTARHTFTTEGRYNERTSLRPDGRITIVVED